MSNRVKVHMIGNAHLDPVWLWSWQAGVDEALATAYTAVKLLKEYPEFIFTRSDSWFHQIVEKLNPELFAEIKKYIDQGRWQLVGGWYIQPDCNLPTEYGFRKQIEIGQGYLKERFNKQAQIGYNVDSFGHVGTLPRLLKEAGYHSYIYMRPGKHEMQYSTQSQVFQWEASDSKDRVTAYRIPVAYTCNTAQLETFIKQVIDESDLSLGHVMCFYGVGDHGGGPTRRQIEFILNNRNKYDGAELVLSHPQAYFDSIGNKTNKLPVIKGELQHHAVGCYSVLHRIKQEVRTAEQKLIQAQRLVGKLSKFAAPTTASLLQKGWEDVLFNQFHDTYGGTCLKTAYPDLYDQLGRARANADQVVAETLRHYSLKLPRLELGEENYLSFFAVMNPHEDTCSSWVEHEFFALGHLKEFTLVQIDTKTKKELEVPYQRLCSEAILDPEYLLRILLPVKLAGGTTQLFGLRKKKAKQITSKIKTTSSQITSKNWQVKAKANGIALLSETTPLGIQFEVHKELSDTWSHEKKRLGDGKLGSFVKDRSFIEETGPLRAQLTWEGHFEHSKIQMLSRVYRDEKWVELIIRLLWNEPRAMVKMVVSPKTKITSRLDGIAGGSQPRPLDGREYPFTDWTLLKNTNNSLAIISPDIFGLDAQEKDARLTLVRSPAYAHHDPAVLNNPKRSYQYTDMGEHEYRILIGTGNRFNAKQLQTIAEQIQQPLIHWDPPYRENYPLG